MIKLLDNGYIELIESWGSDEAIIEAARMSTDKGFKGWGPYCKACGCHPDDLEVAKCPNRDLHDVTPGDEKLLRFLWEHKHMTPFEMAGLIVEVQAPIFVFREWHRHRTQSYNELSARYTELPNMLYMPSDERLAAGKQSTKNKQGSEEGFSEWDIVKAKSQITDAYDFAREMYESLLAKGVSRELARIVIPVGQYSRMRASANLRNWLAFLTLRQDPAAQYEIRVYAEALGEIISKLFPRTYALFQEGK